MPVRNNSYSQVMATYVRRPVFRGLLAAGAIYAVIAPSILHGIWSGQHSGAFNGFVGGICAFFPLPFLIISIAALLSHVREQLENWRGALVTGYVKPHLIIAAAAYLGLCTIATLFWQFQYGSQDWLPGVLAVVLTFMTLSAWASVFRSSWFSLFLVPVFVGVLMLNHRVNFAVNRLMDRGILRGYTDHVIDMHLSWIVPFTVALLIADVGMLAILGRQLARLSAPPSERPLKQWLLQRMATVFARPVPKPSPKAVRHQMIQGLLGRAWHRRVPAITPGAPWLMASVFAIFVSAIYLFLGHYLEMDIHQGDARRSSPPEIAFAILFATIVPAAAVGITWRERHNFLGYESLFPARRGQFSIELSLAMATDLAEYWVAAMLAMLLPVAYFHYAALSSIVLAQYILASAMMQFLSLGLLFWVSRVKAFMPLAVAILCLMVTTLMPFQLSWRTESHPISIANLLAIALIEMACGLALTVGGYFTWKTGELV